MDREADLSEARTASSAQSRPRPGPRTPSNPNQTLFGSLTGGGQAAAAPSTPFFASSPQLQKQGAGVPSCHQELALLDCHQHLHLVTIPVAGVTGQTNAVVACKDCQFRRRNIGRRIVDHSWIYLRILTLFIKKKLVTEGIQTSRTPGLHYGFSKVCP